MPTYLSFNKWSDHEKSTTNIFQLIFPMRPPIPIHAHLYLSLVRACKLPRIQVGNREVRDLMGMEPKLEHSSSSIFLLFFSALIYLFSLPFFGQRPRRGRSTVEHRGTFFCPSIRPFVSPPRLSQA